MKRNFIFTIGAIKDVCERCPDRDITRVEELFSDNDYVTTLDNMAWFISTLDYWGTKKTTGSAEGALTVDDIMLMDMKEIKELFSEAMTAFKNDQKSETEIAPAKKTKATSKTKK